MELYSQHQAVSTGFSAAACVVLSSIVVVDAKIIKLRS